MKTEEFLVRLGPTWKPARDGFAVAKRLACLLAGRDDLLESRDPILGWAFCLDGARQEWFTTMIFPTGEVKVGYRGGENPPLEALKTTMEWLFR
jgi:hypothetical protein